jgi:hypothetical protein
VFTTWRCERFSIGGRDVGVSVFPMSRVDDGFVAEWLDLEARASEGNAFLSPHFVLPALQHLEPRKRLVLVGIFRNDGANDQLIGLGAFIARPPKPQFPLPHLEAYRSPHTFLTGMLLDRDHQWLAVAGLGAYLSSARVPWCGIGFSDRLADSALDQIYQDESVTSMVRWSEYYRHRRAILVPSTAPQMYETVLADGDFGKELRRKRRRLDEKGTVTWRCLLGKEVTSETIEIFLHLENQGWKREHGKSLLSRPGHAEFFRDMVERFSTAGRTFFTELSLDGRVIASTSNFISGKVGFAFKIGWDDEFAAVSPGLLNELELMNWADRDLASLDFIDSGAAEGSFIDRFWRDSRDVVAGILTGGYVGAAVLPAISIARRLKRRLC